MGPMYNPKGLNAKSQIQNSKAELCIWWGIECKPHAQSKIYTLYIVEPKLTSLKYRQGHGPVFLVVLFFAIHWKTRFSKVKDFPRRGFLDEDLADRFSISVSYVSRIFTTEVKVLSKFLGKLVVNPPK